MKQLFFAILIFNVQAAFAQDTVSIQDHTATLYAELGFTFSHFEQQVKSEVGGAKGDLIVDDTNFSFGLASGYHIYRWLSLGLNIRYDAGNRVSGRFGGFDNDGATIVTNKLGGTYSEMWVAPFVKLHYKRLFLSLGYGLVGFRTDEGRADLPSTTGNISESFSLDPSVAYIFSMGGSATITDDLEAVFGIEYRARYYNQRGGNPLLNNVVLGTQNFTPLMGLRYTL